MKNIYSLFIILITYASVYGQTAKIQFTDFTIEIEPSELWKQSELSNRKFKDKAEVYIEFGEGLEGTQIHVKDTEYSNIKIEMRFETSITIMDEGPHCDLINWKHYTSEWSELSPIGINSFETKIYTTQDTQRFPEVGKEEVVEAVKEQCPEWEKYARTITSYKDYPCGIGFSRYFLRISGLNKEGKEIERIITFNNPMGC